MSSLNQDNIELTPQQAQEMIQDYKSRKVPVPPVLEQLANPSTITVRVNRNSPVFEGMRILGEIVSIESEVVTSAKIISKEMVKEHNPFAGYPCSLNLSKMPSIAVSDTQYAGRLNKTAFITFSLKEAPVLANKNSEQSEIEFQIVASVNRELEVKDPQAQAAILENFESDEEMIAFFKNVGKSSQKETQSNLSSWRSALMADIAEETEEKEVEI